MWPTWGPSGADRTQMGPMFAPWTLLSGALSDSLCVGWQQPSLKYLQFCAHIWHKGGTAWLLSCNVSMATLHIAGDCGTDVVFKYLLPMREPNVMFCMKQRNSQFLIALILSHTTAIQKMFPCIDVTMQTWNRQSEYYVPPPKWNLWSNIKPLNDASFWTNTNKYLDLISIFATLMVQETVSWSSQGATCRLFSIQWWFGARWRNELVHKQP